MNFHAILKACALVSQNEDEGYQHSTQYNKIKRKEKFEFKIKLTWFMIYLKKKQLNLTWLITNFKIPACSSPTKAIWVRLGDARWNGKDASGIPLPSRCNSIKWYYFTVFFLTLFFWFSEITPEESKRLLGLENQVSHKKLRFLHL